MKSANEAISSCRHCQLYRSEGRRGGFCEQLGVPVQGSWKACALVTAPFAASWKKLAGINAWQSGNDDPQAEVNLQTLPSPEAEVCANATAMLEEVFLRIE